MSQTVIRHIDAHSPARRAGVQVGETLMQINGHRIIDVLDYKFYAYDPKVTLVLKNPQGEERTLTLSKREGEDLGLEFETYLMDKARSCANNCVFCFVDQMPPNMRESLYFKDDDARLSFLLGNYITLTNLSDREVQRIIDLRVSPVNVSVHTTNPQLRVKMLGHRNGDRGIQVMKRLAQAGIVMNCQIVACPGLNDGAELDRTLEDLSKMHPSVHSVAIVPVGVTKFREGLYPLKPYTATQAAALVAQVEEFAKRHREACGTPLAWCSDEFYLIAGLPLPSEEFYGEFTQLDNGVGMLRLLQGEFSRGLKLLDEEEMAGTIPFSIATGQSAAPLLTELVELAKTAYPPLVGSVYPIVNDFFGHTITVSGLITGGDLIAQLKGKPLGQRLLIPTNMLRSGEQVFLDDVTLEQVETALGVPVLPVEQDGYALCDAMFGMEMEGLGHAPLPEAEYYVYNQ